MDFEDTLASRYSGAAMANLFSPRQRAIIYREIWIALAEAEKELGVNITDEQIAALTATKDQIDFDRIDAIERETKHDVVAHVRAWAEQAGDAGAIIHHGATSALVTDNADIIQQRRGLVLVRDRLVQLMRALWAFSQKHAGTVTLGYTHFQPAQPVTFGKRAAMWLQDIHMDFKDVVGRLDTICCLGAKGATGTQASWLEIFGGDMNAVADLDDLFGLRLGFHRCLPLSGQTYTRKIDVQIADLLANIGLSLHKMGTDLRLLAHTGECREEFSNKQVGSSAMPYKRNPILAERMCALARLTMNYRGSIAESAAVQWLERTLDDSALRRIVIPDQFMAIDGALRVAIGLVGRLEVDTDVVAERLRHETPFLVMETVLAKAVKAGCDRQEAHEALKDAAMSYRRSGGIFIDHIRGKGMLGPILQTAYNESQNSLNAGRAMQQTEEFLYNEVTQDLEEYRMVPEFADAVSK